MLHLYTTANRIWSNSVIFFFSNLPIQVRYALQSLLPVLMQRKQPIFVAPKQQANKEMSTPFDNHH